MPLCLQSHNYVPDRNCSPASFKHLRTFPLKPTRLFFAFVLIHVHIHLSMLQTTIVNDIKIVQKKGRFKQSKMSKVSFS